MSLRSSELMVRKDVSDPECVGVGFMVDIEEEEGSAEWHGVGGRDTGRSPLGVSPSPSSNGSSDGSSGGSPSHASSSEGKRGRLFGRVDIVNSASCREIQVRRVGTRKRLTTLSRCSATACHQCLISSLSSFLSVSSIMVLEVIAGVVFSTHPSLVN